MAPIRPAIKRPQQRKATSPTNGQRPVSKEGESLYYVLLIAAPVTRPGQPPMVEARMSDTVSARGVTERDAISGLLQRIRSNGGEATIDRLRVWRSLWRPPHPSTTSYEAT
jgi:hypothetical protein